MCNQFDERLRSLLRPDRRLAGLCQFYKYYIPHLAHKLLPFYLLIFKIFEEHELAFDGLKEALRKSIEVTLKHPLAGKQFVMLTDASKYAAGFVLMLEDKIITKRARKSSSSHLWLLEA